MARPDDNRARRRAAEARAAAEAAEKRRRRIINASIGALLVVVVVALVGGAWWSTKSGKTDGQPSPDAALPQGVMPANDPYAYGVDATKAVAGKPVLSIWEDFQCPACGKFEAAYAPTVMELAKSGAARVIWRPTSFLDSNFPGENSKRAVAAWGCAIDAGKKDEFHQIVFANQPQVEGQGWSNDQLIAFGQQVGIKGDQLVNFQQCVSSGKYTGWSVNSTDAMRSTGVSSTPALYVNGQELPDSALKSPEALKKAVLDAGAPKQ